jgi:Na+-driven multidrug efflux pump
MTQRRVLSLATPISGENLLQTLVGVGDTFMVARLSAAAVAGVGTGFEIVFSSSRSCRRSMSGQRCSFPK